MSDKEHDQVIKDEKDAERAYQKELTEEDTAPPTAPPIEGAVQPGCSEPNTVPPSVTGTTQDPNRKEN